MDNMERLLNTLSKTTENIEPDESIIGELSSELCSIYSETTFRHSYSELSSFFENLIAEQRDMILTSLDMVLLYMDKENINYDVITKIVKLLDHLQLETIRLSRIEHIDLIGNRVVALNQETENMLKQNKQESEDLRKKINNVNAQIITVLGIFAGLVIMFSTTIQIATETFKNINFIDFYKILYLGVNITFVLYNFLFMMMYVVAKIAGVSLAVKCRNRSCDGCFKNHISITRLFRKYPYILWMDIVFILLIAFLTILLKYKNIL